MKNKMKIALLIKIVIGVAIVALIAVGGTSYYKKQQFLKTQAMEVEGKKVLVSDIKNEINYQLAKLEYAQGKAATKEEYNKLKDEATKNMTQRIVVLKNIEGKLNLKDDSIQEEADKRINSVLPDDKSKNAFIKVLGKYNLSLEDAKKDFENSIIVEKAREVITAAYVPSDDEAKRYYEANKDKYAVAQGKVNVSAIALKSGAEGNTVFEKLQKGEKFEELAKTYSTDDKTKNLGGLMGDIPTNSSDYDPDFIKQASRLEPGKYSEVLIINGTNYIIKLNSKTSLQYKSFERVKDEIKKNSGLVDAYKGKQAQDAIDKWMKDAKISRDEAVISQI